MVRSSCTRIRTRVGLDLLSLSGILLLLAGCPQADDPADEPPEGDLTANGEAVTADPGEPLEPREPTEDVGARGLEFVASGVDPDWELEVERGGQLTLSPVFGMDAIEVPAPPPVHADETGITTYYEEMGELTLLVEIHDEECQDPRGLDLYEATVRIRVDDREMTGCGSWLLNEP